MNVLVTGGAGFIGSHVADEFLRLGFHVTVLDDLSGGFEQNIPSGARFIRGSVTDAALVEQVFSEGRFELVFHLAAYAAEGLSHFIRAYNYTNNVVGSMQIINACVRHHVPVLGFTSSIAVYGTNQLPMLEETEPRPEDPYGIAKYAVELDLRAAKRMFGLDSVVFRPHNVYGERQNIGDRYRNVIGIFMSQIMRGEPLTVFGDGEQKRAFSHICDVAPVMVKALLNPACRNETYNVGSDAPHTVNELIGYIGQAFGVEPRVTYLDARNEVKEAYASHDKIRRAVPGAEPLTLQEGITRMSEWAKRHGPRKGDVFANIEVWDHLPPFWAQELQQGPTPP
ncbi:MAG: NAD-dependent epimerase/dehydratase family protein [Verrucomicrobiota bacterium]|jgi:UDP-glucose 4-epimerase|nr:NAD-dependent epimerase/dehydratase family protein [Verrucomicrobiota bacterium]